MRKIRTAAVILALALGASFAMAAAPDNTSKMPGKRPSDYETGRRLWAQSCWQCHGLRAAGDGPAARALPGGVPSLEAKLKNPDVDALVRVIQDGRGRMPAYSENIDTYDSRRIVTYLRDLLAGKTPEPEMPSEGGEAGGGEGQ